MKSQQHARKNTRKNPWITTVTLFASLAVIGVANAAFGPLAVQSHLGEPLQARVEVTGEQAQELRAGNRAIVTGHAGLSARTVTEGARTFVVISSKNTVSDAILNFGLSLGSGGQQYTALINPRNYAFSVATPKTTRNIAPPKAGSRYTPLGGESVSAIAEKIRVKGVSVKQVIDLIVKNNPNAFKNANPNHLLRGVALQLPSIDAMKAAKLSANSVQVAPVTEVAKVEVKPEVAKVEPKVEVTPQAKPNTAPDFERLFGDAKTEAEAAKVEAQVATNESKSEASIAPTGAVMSAIAPTANKASDKPIIEQNQAPEGVSDTALERANDVNTVADDGQRADVVAVAPENVSADQVAQPEQVAEVVNHDAQIAQSAKNTNQQKPYLFILVGVLVAILLLLFKRSRKKKPAPSNENNLSNQDDNHLNIAADSVAAGALAGAIIAETDVDDGFEIYAETPAENAAEVVVTETVETVETVTEVAPVQVETVAEQVETVVETAAENVTEAAAETAPSLDSLFSGVNEAVIAETVAEVATVEPVKELEQTAEVFDNIDVSAVQVAEEVATSTIEQVETVTENVAETAAETAHIDSVSLTFVGNHAGNTAAKTVAENVQVIENKTKNVAATLAETVSEAAEHADNRPSFDNLFASPATTEAVTEAATTLTETAEQAPKTEAASEAIEDDVSHVIEFDTIEIAEKSAEIASETPNEDTADSLEFSLDFDAEEAETVAQAAQTEHVDDDQNTLDFILKSDDEAVEHAEPPAPFKDDEAPLAFDLGDHSGNHANDHDREKDSIFKGLGLENTENARHDDILSDVELSSPADSKLDLAQMHLMLNNEEAASEILEELSLGSGSVADEARALLEKIRIRY